MPSVLLCSDEPILTEGRTGVEGDESGNSRGVAENAASGNPAALVDGGELWFEKALTDSLITTRRHTLTPREGQLVALLPQGLKNKEIATAMDLSEGSVKVCLSRLFHKLGVKDRLELALFVLKNLTPGMGPPLLARAPCYSRGRPHAPFSWTGRRQREARP